MTHDEMSPMQMYIAGGGDTSNGRAMALMFEAERGHNRRQRSDVVVDSASWDERHAHDERDREEFLTHCRPAGPEDYRAWLAGYLSNGGQVTHPRDWDMPGTYYVLESTPAGVPSLYGALSLEVIVPAGVLSPGDIPRTFHGGCGHSTFFFMDGFEVLGSIVESFRDAH